MSFKRYESRPITRLAHEITESDTLLTDDKGNWVTSVDGLTVRFKAYETPVAGDFIVHLDETDVYHVRRDVFVQRNVVDAA